MRSRQRRFLFKIFIAPVLSLALMIGALLFFPGGAARGIQSTLPVPGRTDVVQPQPVLAAQPIASAARVLSIPQWGVRIPLPAGMEDVYYTFADANVDDSGAPVMAWLGKKTLDAKGCDVSGRGPVDGAQPIGAILRVLPTATDPISGQLYTAMYPNGVTIGEYYYTYMPWANRPCLTGASSQSVDAALGGSAKGAVRTTDTTN